MRFMFPPKKSARAGVPIMRVSAARACSSRGGTVDASTKTERPLCMVVEAATAMATAPKNQALATLLPSIAAQIY